MGDTVEESKTGLRRRIRGVLQSLSEARRRSLSELACARLRQQGIWKNSQSILFYAPVAGELDIWPLVSEAQTAGKTIALPRFASGSGVYTACRVQDLKEIQAGQFGIREPTEICAKLELNRLDLILVPGIAFDLQGRRLGRGKGFYDRLLATLRGTTCGVAFDEQIIDQIPVAPHDRYVNCILTPTRWLQL